MNTQQECTECPGNDNLSWQEPAVIQLCYESEVFGDNCRFGTSALFDCESGINPVGGCFTGHSFVW